MDREEGESLLLSVQQEYVDCIEQKKVLDGRIEGLLTIMDGLDKMFPGLVVDVVPPTEEPRPGVPKGKDAVLIALAWGQSEWMSVADVTAALERRGWLPDSPTPQAPVRTALERLLDSDYPVAKMKDSDGVRYHYELSTKAEVYVDDDRNMVIDNKDGSPVVVIPPLPRLDYDYEVDPDDAERYANYEPSEDDIEAMAEWEREHGEDA